MALLLAALTLAGCVAPLEGALAPSGLAGTAVVGPDGSPVPFAAVTAVGATGALRLLATDGAGTFDAALLPPGTTSVAVAANGFAPATLPVPLPARISLAADAGALLAADATPALRFLPAIDLGGGVDWSIDGTGATCGQQNCGLSEPVLEVAGDGTIYVSATCCVSRSPPVWASRDGGATFERMGALYREAVGIEGDFAVDDAGNVYFTDILLGVVWFTSWDKDGAERWTLPVPFPPLVDRPWVRAGEADTVYFAYNTGYDTLFYRSTDGGLSWGAPLYRTGAGLGDLGQGPENEHLYMVAGEPADPLDGGGGDGLLLHETLDGGTTWETPTKVPIPKGDGFVADRRVPVADESGNLWVVYSWATDDGAALYASRRDASGTWAGPFPVSAPGGAHVLPWPAALRDGTLVVAWYGAPWAETKDGQVADDTQWFLQVGATLDGAAASGSEQGRDAPAGASGGADAPTFQVVMADPLPVATGPLGRRLLDFLQVDVSPDGAIHIAYAAERPGAPERTFYVRSTTGLDFAPAVFPYGPGAEDGNAQAGLGAWPRFDLKP